MSDQQFVDDAGDTDDPYGLGPVPAAPAPAEAPADLGSAPELEEVVFQLADGMEDLAARLETLEQQRAQELDPDTLPEWVDWLRETYALGEMVSTRWDSVPGVHQELAALRAFHVSCYDEDGNPRLGVNPVQWHDALARVLDRLSERWMKRETSRAGSQR